jgi:hypothetical protein
MDIPGNTINVEKAFGPKARVVVLAKKHLR